MYPEKIILCFSEEITTFKRVLFSDNFPHIDLDAALQLLVDAVSELIYADKKILDIANEMSTGDILFSNVVLSSEQKTTISDLITKTCFRIKQELTNSGVYCGNKLPYKFIGTLNESAIILGKSDN